MFNLINQQPGIDKIFIYTKDPYEAKYQFLINKREITGLRNFKDSKTFDMDDIYQNIEKYNSSKKCKILFVFDNMIADMLCNKILDPVVTE